MSSRRRLLLPLLAVLLILAAVAAVLYFRHSAGVATATVTRGSIQVTVETVGRLKPENQVAVTSPLDGTIQLLAVQTGDVVRQGDIVATLDPAPYQAAVDQAQAAVAAAEADLNVQEQIKNPTTEQTTAKLQASQKLDQARQSLQQAQDNLVKTLVLAPQNGTIVDVGVSNGGRIAAGTPVVQLADLSKLVLSVDLDEVDFPRVQTGMTAQIRFDAFPGQEIDGTITRISPVAQTSGGTTTFPLTVSFQPPPAVELRPGMNASVSIQTAVRQNVLLIPEAALRTVGQRTFVTVVTGGTQQEREIKVGLRSGGQVEVASGLAEGDRVVLH